VKLASSWPDHLDPHLSHRIVEALEAGGLSESSQKISAIHSYCNGSETRQRKAQWTRQSQRLRILLSDVRLAVKVDPRLE
jgi:hypothetical protein